MRPSGIAGKIAVVTGAAHGIGAEVVRALHGEGAQVAAFDIDGPVVAALATSLDNPAAHVRGERVDVTRAADVDAAIARVEAEWGPIAIGVNVAGVLNTALVVDTDDAMWDHVFDVNTRGVFNVSRALARRMVPRRRGDIVTVSSNAAGVPRHGMAAYAASKAAATMFTKSLGLELASAGIRCNIVAPGSTRTRMQEATWDGPGGAERVVAGAPALFKVGIPLGKLAEPRDVADAVIFLLSDMAGHITMADLYVDGGATLRG